MSILQKKEVRTAADLVAVLAPLGARPLTQIITASELHEDGDVDWHNQIEHFVWDIENKELEVQL